jgi:hypothetical protein
LTPQARVWPRVTYSRVSSIPRLGPEAFRQHGCRDRVPRGRRHRVRCGLVSPCLWLFASVGRGTPGPWDTPRRFVAVGPYRWVRNPIYISALLVVLGEAWLFLSPPLLGYAGVMMIGCHLFVIGYEEPTLRRRFGDAYNEYLGTVSRWIPMPPRQADLRERAISFAMAHCLIC